LEAHGTMHVWVIRRLAICAGTIALASFLTFDSLYLAPGDPISFLIGTRPSTPQTRAALAEQFHLNDPFLQRYWDWLKGILHGDFGESIVRHQPVTDLVRQSLGTTVLLVAMTFVMVVILGVVLGAVAALKPGKVDDGLLSLMSVSVAIPAFVAAVILISIFAVQLGWFPVFGPGDGFVDRLHHLVLPSVALAIAWWPVIGQSARAAMREELSREHVDTARSRGLSRGHILRRHVLRNALIPITTVSGLTFAGLIAGTAVVETAFQLNGIGGLLISSVSGRDFPVAQAVALLLVTVFALTNLLVDLAYPLLDPRVRLTVSTA
jgi:peptide/nickel transport system permease protein